MSEDVLTRFPFTASQSLTGATFPCVAAGSAGILRSPWVTMLAAAGLCIKFSGGKRTLCEYIFAGSHDAKMLGVHAASIAADVVELQRTRGKWSDEKKIGSAMGEPSGGAWKFRISIPPNPTAPLPATIWQRTNKSEEALQARPFPRRSSTKKGRTSTPPSSVMKVAPAPHNPVSSATTGDATLFLHRKVRPFVATQPEVICLAAASILADWRTGRSWTREHGIAELRREEAGRND